MYLFLKSVHDSKRIIKDFKPDVVIGTGGYVCGAVVYAAARLKIPTMIHEQNSVAGVTNKYAADRTVNGVWTWPWKANSDDLWRVTGSTAYQRSKYRYFAHV